MFVTNWISTTKIQKISEITNFFRHYFLSRTEVTSRTKSAKTADMQVRIPAAFLVCSADLLTAVSRPAD